MNGAKVILECLKKEGIDTIFGYPGGAVIPLYDALYDYSDDFKHIRTSHEQGLVHAADGYARSTNTVGVCFTTSGPGATNAITGIATAFMDSSPMVVISGQVPTSLLGKDSFQEIDITGATLSMTKHNYLVRNTKELVPTIKEAFRVANSGRKGPVLVDVPKDLFLAEMDFSGEDYDLCQIDDYMDYKSDFDLDDETNIKLLNEAIDIIKESKKPVIYAGGGVKSSDSEEILEKFATKIDTPVLNTLMGLGNIDRKNELSLGMVGMHGSRESNLALSNSDLVIAIGARFSDRVISKSSEFAKNAKIIHIDIDPSEISKNIESNVSLVGDVKLVLSLLIERVESKNNSNWKEEIKTFRKSEGVQTYEFHPQNILKKINEKYETLKKPTVVVTDVGQHQMWAAKYWNFKGNKSFITSAGLGTMGFGLGAAIGTKVGNVDKNVVLVTGDGSFRMNCNELATVANYNVPMLILLLNNRTLGMVRQWQKLFSNQRYSQTDINENVDYVKLVNAYNIDGYKVASMEELGKALDMIDFNKPVFLQCDIDKDYDVYPIVAPNDALENLICN
ncbi:TPA: biosynthetic-type acetolactate synthase large subunit [Clostridioides difficile]|uniref:biosynthetic-type acetolactate synthase large subunit n=1 Tax=Clostridioides difficile TaxID=1496 RepID=UPI00016C65E6|nr:biosynthetic-type acetolactate synthase large subunit [Clostridioides difficile]EJX2686214.1 biosynthetic-type acetolactate synthase large subunit [Clostridioides difficile]EKG0814864.1 biosynthetic-type acetolactate synthase large subunit [Clostridioides difficile]EQE41258.1 acetolactate synthase, large subunit, biosynthetic type [Clostridioides difficile CD40]EQE71456.1 acetolactate synthase, large subunit, biosynthetic type [Clostridioides difficile CD47]EQF29548.1 acetolactate synthase,